MQVIRLARGGRKKYPVYRIVSADKRRPVNGKFLTVLGTYNPHTKQLVIKKEELQAAITNGAQLSNAVLKLMQKDGLDLPQWAKIETRKRPPKKAPTEPAESAQSAESAGTASPPAAAEGEDASETAAEPAAESAKPAANSSASTPAEESSAAVETEADTERPNLKVEKGEEETPAELTKSAKGEQRGKAVADVVIEEAQAENAATAATKKDQAPVAEAEAPTTDETK